MFSYRQADLDFTLYKLLFSQRKAIFEKSFTLPYYTTDFEESPQKLDPWMMFCSFDQENLLSLIFSSDCLLWCCHRVSILSSI